MSLLVSGPMSVPDLKAYCEDLKDRMQEAGVSLIKIEGFSDHQLRVSLSDAALRRIGLSAAQVAERIAAQSKDIPLGTIETRERDILLRFVDQRRTPEALEKLVILAGPEGGEIRLGDIAKVEDLFERDEDKIMTDGRRNALLKIEKSKTQDAIRVAQKVKAFVEDERERHPQMELTITQDETTILSDRLNMLITNGIQGLLLVFVTMWLFFNVRISFWVAMGLPVSFLGAFILVPHLGLSINMFTMVGLLMALGLLMDDAIVIAENIMAPQAEGEITGRRGGGRHQRSGRGRHIFLYHHHLYLGSPGLYRGSNRQSPEGGSHDADPGLGSEPDRSLLDSSRPHQSRHAQF